MAAALVCAVAAEPEVKAHAESNYKVDEYNFAFVTTEEDFLDAMSRPEIRRIDIEGKGWGEIVMPEGDYPDKMVRVFTDADMLKITLSKDTSLEQVNIGGWSGRQIFVNVEGELGALGIMSASDFEIT